MERTQIVDELRKEAHKLNAAADILEENGAPTNGASQNSATQASNVRRPKRVMSAETRAKLSQAQRARWAQSKRTSRKAA